MSLNSLHRRLIVPVILSAVLLFLSTIGNAQGVVAAELSGPSVVEFSVDGVLGISGDLDSGSQGNLDRSLRQEARNHGRASRIRSLIQRGANVNGAAEYGETALFYSIQFGRVKAALQLISLGAEPNAENDLGRTALQKASENCQDQVVEALLKLGAHINHTDQAGRSALIYAVQSSCVRTVAILLTRGKGKIDLEIQDVHFRRAEDYVQDPWIKEMLAQTQVQKGNSEFLKPVLH